MASVWNQVEAEQAFSRAARARRRVALACRVRRHRCGCDPLPVLQPRAGAGAAGRADVALADIRGTLEPNRVAQFDAGFRPARSTRSRWERVWRATHDGATLPPVRLVATARGYAVRDGHHRVSVARASGALTIDAIVA